MSSRSASDGVHAPAAAAFARTWSALVAPAITLDRAGRDEQPAEGRLEHRDPALVAEVLEALERVPRSVLPDMPALHHDPAACRTAARA